MVNLFHLEFMLLSSHFGYFGLGLGGEWHWHFRVKCFPSVSVQASLAPAIPDPASLQRSPTSSSLRSPLMLLFVGSSPCILHSSWLLCNHTDMIKGNRSRSSSYSACTKLKEEIYLLKRELTLVRANKLSNLLGLCRNAGN